MRGRGSLRICMAQEIDMQLRSRLAQASPQISTDRIDRFLQQFPDRYYEKFSPEELALHLESIESLGPNTPVAVDVRRDEPESENLQITVIGYDYPGEFSVITGLLSAYGVNVSAGDVYTSIGNTTASNSGATEPGNTLSHRQLRERRRSIARQRIRRFKRHESGGGPARVIVDRFNASAESAPSQWEPEFRQKLHYLSQLLLRNTDQSLEEAKQKLHEEVAAALSKRRSLGAQNLYPVQLEVEQTESNVTRMKVLSEDTPFFLYALSTAFALHDISIEHVKIRTVENQIEDTFEVVDSSGNPVTDSNRLNQIRLSVIFTKQFTHFLHNSPDPYSALVRFETLIQDFVHLSEDGRLQQMLSSPNVLQDLARLLGASDFLWEDFIRLQHDSLLPMLQNAHDSHSLSMPPEQMEQALSRRIGAAKGIEEKKAALNDFKDHQTYLVDLDHIINRDLDFFFLSRRLTAVAETVVRHAVGISWDALKVKYGVPRTVAGIEAPYAIMGLGKLGGEALGYASDIELMFLYGDDGSTDGPEQITNAEFFQRLFHDAVQLIEAKREGIFQVDLRLRPHGSAGPIATSLSNFVSYYRNEAMSFEKLALVRMRHVGGDQDLGQQVERIRDDLIYAADSIDLVELKRLRNKQLEEKSSPGKLNAKFSPGGLVDLEYAVQILQVTYGRTVPKLRTPRIHQALDALVEAGEIEEETAERLLMAYRFLRNLINGLRMLRGHAKDLFLPPVDSLEYMHLARRAGYEARGELSPAERLHMEFEARTADVRVFVERELGRDALPGNPRGTIADLILADTISEERRDAILSEAHFAQHERSYRNFKSLAGTGERRYRFAELAILAWDALRSTPDPDMALNNWDRFGQSLDEPEAHFEQLSLQPKRLEILLQLFAGSQFLADTLIRNPDFFDWVTEPSIVTSERTEGALYDELVELSANSNDEKAWKAALRRFRKREICRIGTRDIALGVDIRLIMTELSNLARAFCRVILHREEAEADRSEPPLSRFAVLAFGKLGGRELNYSSDIDLLGIFESAGQEQLENESKRYSRAMRRIRDELGQHTEEGYAYRIDFRLRPFGSASALVHSLDSIERYYRESASLWEYQALLKLSPVAGNQELAVRFLDHTKPHFQRQWDRNRVVETIREMRQAAVRQSASGSLGGGLNVKTGEGGIRDVEFLVQGIQMIHAAQHSELLQGNTLEALRTIRTLEILSPEVIEELEQDYLFLRRLEHFLQIFQDRQVHSLPKDKEGYRALANRMKRAHGFEEEFDTVLDRVRSRVRAHYDTYLTARSEQ